MSQILFNTVKEIKISLNGKSFWILQSPFRMTYLDKSDVAFLLNRWDGESDVNFTLTYPGRAIYRMYFSVEMMNRLKETEEEISF